MKKKLLSLILSLLLIITVFSIPANAWVQYTKPSDVSGSDYTDNPAFAKALDDLFDGDIDLYKDKKRTKEVSMPLGFRVSMNDPYYMYSTSRGTSTYGWTCFIYSNGAFNKLFGEYVHRGDALKNCYIAVGKGATKMTYDLLNNANIRAGAYIRTSPKSDGSYYGEDGHSMIILAYDKTHITYLEGNGDGKGLVRITKRTYAEFNSAQLTGRGRKVTHIVQPTEEWFNTLYPNGPETYTYTLSYNANGGSGEAADLIIPFNSEFTLDGEGFDHQSYNFGGFNLKRDTDGKWLCKNGWSDEKDVTEDNPRTVIASGEKLILDDSFITDSLQNHSYTAYAVWNEVPYDKCVSVKLVSTPLNRESYPVDSTVSFADSVVEFTFESGNTLEVKINKDCSSTVSQTFRYNKHDYSFYIDAEVEKYGDNPCFVRISDLTAELTTVKGAKAIDSTKVSGTPTAMWGENAEITLNYNDQSYETVKAVSFVAVEVLGCVTGRMLTDGGFYIDWTYNVEVGENPSVSYSCGATFSLTLGDIDMDGSISTTDLAALKLILSKENTELYEAFLTSDINADGQVSTLDLAKIKLSLAGI